MVLMAQFLGFRLLSLLFPLCFSRSEAYSFPCALSSSCLSCSPCLSLPLSRSLPHPLSLLGRKLLPSTRFFPPFFLSPCFPLSGLCLPHFWVSVWNFSVASVWLRDSICVVSAFVALMAHLPLPPLSTQQALQFAKAVDEELEDLKSLAKSLEEQNHSLLAQTRQTVGSGQGARRYPLPSPFLESEQQSLTGAGMGFLPHFRTARFRL